MFNPKFQNSAHAGRFEDKFAFESQPRRDATTCLETKPSTVELDTLTALTPDSLLSQQSGKRKAVGSKDVGTRGT